MSSLYGQFTTVDGCVPLSFCIHCEPIGRAYVVITKPNGETVEQNLKRPISNPNLYTRNYTPDVFGVYYYELIIEDLNGEDITESCVDACGCGRPCTAGLFTWNQSWTKYNTELLDKVHRLLGLYDNPGQGNCRYRSRVKNLGSAPASLIIYKDGKPTGVQTPYKADKSKPNEYIAEVNLDSGNYIGKIVTCANLPSYTLHISACDKDSNCKCNSCCG